MNGLLAPPVGRYESNAIVDDLLLTQTEAVAHIGAAYDIVPRLGVILANGPDGQVDPASLSYVKRKEKHGVDIGAESDIRTVGRHGIALTIMEFNDDPDVHGIMAQLPFPRMTWEAPADLEEFTRQQLGLIGKSRDVDGLRPRPLGEPFDETVEYPPATPAAGMHMLAMQNTVPLASGARVLVSGSQGFLMGRHMERLLEAKGITPILHDKKLYDEGVTDKELEDALRAKIEQADIVISCVGLAGIIKLDMLPKKRAMVIIDAGLQRVDGELRGDLDPGVEEGRKNILWTPPKKGVGPVTVGMLWQSTIKSAERAARR